MLSGSQRGVRLLPPGLSVALAMLGALLLSAYGYRHRLLVAIHDPMQWADEPIARSELLRQLGSDALLGVSVAALTWLVLLMLLPLGRWRWLRLSGLLLFGILTVGHLAGPLQLPQVRAHKAEQRRA